MTERPYRIDGATMWERVTDPMSRWRCRRCSRTAVFIRSTFKRSKSGSSIDYSGFCEVHLPPGAPAKFRKGHAATILPATLS
jgi:hypothetical protein